MPPALTRVSGRGLLAAAANVLRAGVLLGALLTLVLARAGVPAPVLAAMAVLAVGALYAFDRRRGGFALFAVYLVGFVVFALLRTTADDTGITVKANYAVNAERWLFAGTLPTQWLQDRLYQVGTTSVLDVLCICLYLSYYLVPQVVALVLWRTRPERFRPYALAVLITVYAGLAVSFLLPTAPPWLAAEYGGGPPLARVLADVLGWNPEHAGAPGEAGVNPFAAMPSLHFALTVLVAIALWRYRRLRPVGLAYAAAMGFALVYLGEHYVVDEIAGLAAATLGWAAAVAVLGRRAVPSRRAAAPRAAPSIAR